MSGNELHKALTRRILFVAEKHPGVCIAYPIGIRGAVVGQGETHDEALADARSAVAFHVETFGAAVLEAV